ncbi:MAG TPA: sialidase family protein, partial [Ktedonobacterales bacterium]|nr:sialidase family protein [Ktedonobacterales bacterium]
MAAMLAVVVLLAVVLKTFVRPHVGTSTSTINTRTPATSATPSFAGRWKVLSRFSGIPAPQPDAKNPSLVVAPSNPLIAYQVTFVRSGSKSASISIQRTDNGGASWGKIALPTAIAVDSNVAGVHLLISPLNASYLFLSVDWFTPGCSTFAQYGVCSGQYMSQDSGSGPWVSPYMPTSGDLWNLQVGDDGHLLYGTIYTPTYSSGASPANGLMVSDDGGMRWRAADSDLTTAGLGISSSAAATSGPTVYAVTEPAQPDPQHDPTYQLWRSDDAGVHWSHVGGAPPNMPGTLLASGGSQSILYFQQSASPNQPSPQLTFSIDGGYTWNPVPLVGVDPVDAQSDTLPLVLNDGSLLATFRDGNDTRFFIWAPGGSWREVAPLVHLQSIASM